jgi:hypothetical protein
MTRTLTCNLVIVALLVTALGFSPALVSSSLAQPGPSTGPSGPNTTITDSLSQLGKSIGPEPNTTITDSLSQLGQSIGPEPNTTMSEETEEIKDIEPENRNKTSRQGDAQQGKFCLKGTGPGTGKTCIPCNPTTQGESECPVLPLQQGETISKKESKPPKTLSSWYKSGLQDLEKEKMIPSGTSKAIESFQKGDPSALIKICNTISKDPNADVKSADCNSLQGKTGTTTSESAEEVSWIISGWVAGKLLANTDGNGDDNNNDTSVTP